MKNYKFQLEQYEYDHNQSQGIDYKRSKQRMKRLTQNIIFNLSSLQKGKCNVRLPKRRSFVSSSLLGRVDFKFSNENMSSREIDLKISEERWKNLQNNFKALKTSFGLVVPSQISKNYPTPDIIEYTLQSLRECSNKYPQYLFEELKKEDSRFYRVIDVTLGNLWKAEKKQALEFISFVIHWRIHLSNEEIGEILLRTIKKMEVNMFEIFQLLKYMFKLSEGQMGQTVASKGQKIDNNKKQGQLNNKQTAKKQLLSGAKLVQNMDHVFKKMLVICENKIILRLEVIQPQEYEPLFKIINMLRHYDIYPEIKSEQSASSQDKEATFFDVIQRNILKNLSQIPPSTLVIMAVHYANNTKQDQDERIKILQRLEEKIIFNLKFFTHQQLVAIVYSYLRSSMMSNQFREQVVARIRLIYHELTWANKKKVLSLCSNFPAEEKMLIITEAQGELLRGKPVITKLEDGSLKKEYDPKVYIEPDYQLVPQIYLASYENNLLTEELCKRMQNIILENIYNYDREEVVRSVWLFTATPQISNNLQRLHKKLQVIIEGGFQGGQYTIRDISILVWSLCNSGPRNQTIYRPEAEFWNNIEFYLQEKLQKQSESYQNRLGDVSSILWAYTFNRPLKFKTVSLITDILLQQMDTSNRAQNQVSLQSFQLINVITFYYSLPQPSLPLSLVKKIKQLSVQYFQSLYLQMNSLQLLKCLKYLAGDEKEGQSRLVIKLKMWENIVQIFNMEVQTIEYQHIMGIVGMVLDSPLGRSRDRNVVSLVNKLMRRKKSLEQIKSLQSQK